MPRQVQPHQGLADEQGGRPGDREVRVTPVLVAARTELKPGETFFNVLEVRLLEVQADGKVSRAVEMR